MSPRISSQWLWYSCSQGMICSGATRNRGLKAWPRAACKCKGRGKNQNQVYTKSERRNARERLVLLQYSEVPLPSPQAKTGSRENTSATYKSSPSLHQDIHQPLQREQRTQQGQSEVSGESVATELPQLSKPRVRTNKKGEGIRTTDRFSSAWGMNAERNGEQGSPHSSAGATAESQGSEHSCTEPLPLPTH